MKRTIIIAALLALASISAGAFASDLSSIANSQARIASKVQSAEQAQQRSDALKSEGIAITTEIFYAFYQQASKAGIKFDAVNEPASESSAGVTTTRSVVESRDNGKFVVYSTCFLGCEIEPSVNIRGDGYENISMIFDGPNGEPSACEDGVRSLACTCRFAVFSDFLSMPCSEVFDRSKRARVTHDVIAWMNKSLVAEMKAREMVN